MHIRHWSWFLDENNGYYRAAPPPWSVGAAIVVGVLATCVLFLAAKAAAESLLPRSRAREVSMAGFITIAVLALNGVRHQARGLILSRSVPSWLPVLALLGAGIAFVVVVLRWRTRVARALVMVILWLLPFAGLTVGRTLWFAVKQQGTGRVYTEKPPAPTQTGTPGRRRVLLLLFDGLDENQAFGAAAQTPMPSFARLRREVVECVQAYPPSFATDASLPALLVGGVVSEIRPAGPDDLRLKLQGRAGSVFWSREPTLLGEARLAGFNVGVVGWYHPYCRIFGSDLTSCRAHTYLPEPDYSLAGTARWYAACFVETIPGAMRYGLVPRLHLEIPTPQEGRTWHAAQCRAVETEALRAAVDKDLGLVFVHYPVPHPPYVYSGREGRYDTSGANSYSDNLVLSDDIVGRLRSAMEQAGVWESTNVIVTADHWNRDQEIPFARSPFPIIGYPAHRVPVLIKLAGQQSRVEFAGVFRTYNLHGLALAVLRGEVESPSAATAWLGQHSESLSGAETDRGESHPRPPSDRETAAP